MSTEMMKKMMMKKKKKMICRVLEDDDDVVMFCDAWTHGSVCDALSMMSIIHDYTDKLRDKQLGLTGA